MKEGDGRSLLDGSVLEMDVFSKVSKNTSRNDVPCGESLG